MKKIYLIVLAATLILSGCSTLNLNSRASHVVVSSKRPPLGCRFIGHVVGDQLYDLKNQTTKLGGNYVQLVSSSKHQLGKAYVCVPSKIGKIRL
jgi:predicted component of type VI protein secretion system